MKWFVEPDGFESLGLSGRDPGRKSLTYDLGAIDFSVNFLFSLPPHGVYFISHSFFRANDKVSKISEYTNSYGEPKRVDLDLPRLCSVTLLSKLEVVPIYNLPVLRLLKMYR